MPRFSPCLPTFTVVALAYTEVMIIAIIITAMKIITFMIMIIILVITKKIIMSIV